MERRYLVVKIDAGNDRNGNPRRGWLVYEDSPGSPWLGWIEEGYGGWSLLYHAILCAEWLRDRGTPAQIPTIADILEMRDSGRVRIVCSLDVPYSEVRASRASPFRLPGGV